jgi:hypothetical protein
MRTLAFLIDPIAELILPSIGSWRFFVFYGVCLSALFTGETMGMLLCSLFGNVGIANMLSAVSDFPPLHVEIFLPWTYIYTIFQTLFSLLLLMCGFFRSQSTLPYPLRYLNYVFITKYCGEVLAINQFQGLSISCPASQSINGAYRLLKPNSYDIHLTCYARDMYVYKRR